MRLFLMHRRKRRMKCYTCNGECRGFEYHKNLREEIEQMNENWATAQK